MALDIIGHISLEVTQLTSAQKTAMLDDLCATHGYQEQVEDPENEGQMIDNPETKKAFANRMILEQIKRWVNGWRRSEAKKALEVEELELS